MMSRDQYVEVAFPMHFNQTFTYRWSSEFTENPVGYRVLVPFQKRLLTGYVLDQTKKSEFESIKDVQDVLDEMPVLTQELITLIHFIRDRYGASLGDALQTVIPPGLIKQTKKKIVVTAKEGNPTEGAEKSVLDSLRSRKNIDYETWKKRNPRLISTLHRLHKDGWVSFETILQKQRAREKKKNENNNSQDSEASVDRPALTMEQKEIVDHVMQSIQSAEPETILVHGVTGSGKTEVYLRSAEECLKAGKTVLALVPEISLTPQFLNRFKQRFGQKIALLHSLRSESERLMEWKRILDGKAQIVVGTRSSVFSPLRKIGLIIMDEEHDRSYKQEDHVLYHVKDVVQERARRENAVVLMGSATPAVETFHFTETTIRKKTLSRRIHSDEMPHVEIVDLQKEKGFGENTVFSQSLKDAIEETLREKKQTILFLNRRGYSTHVYCPLCGSTLQCTNCSISMTYHQETSSFQCHYCDFSVSTKHPCEHCQVSKWIRFGFGTEKVEKELKFLFPDAVIDRLDRDTARKKNAFETAFNNFEQRKTDILIGTQMITKGLDFEHVDLVGVLLADQGLHFPDFRAAENTFQLLTQVIGRSGRGQKRGRAFLQTLQPQHYAIVAAAKQDYAEFYDHEIKYRKAAFYPPFSKTFLFEVRGQSKASVEQMAMWLRKQIELKMKDKASFEILGPSPAPVEKVKSNHRVHLFIKAKLELEIEPTLKWIYVQSKEEFQKRKLHIKFNIDPFDFM